MAILTSLTSLAIAFAIAQCAPPDVSCPVPLSPEHGQVFMYQEGRVVKYVCEPGYVLNGREINRCIDGEWENPSPSCSEFGTNAIKEPGDAAEPVPPSPPRPLFNWDSEDNQDEKNQQDINSTSEEMPLGDEARIHLLMYPRRRVVTSSALRSGTELEEEEKKRSGGQSETRIHLQAPPSMVYVRRTVIPGKSDVSRQALHMSVENGHNVEVVSVPEDAVIQNDKGQTNDDYYRQLYYYSHYYPRSASLVDYRAGVPAVMTLTESQLAWINSLHPELRDQYLRSYGIVDASQAYAYNYYYNYPYLRQPMAMSMDYTTVATTYDYSCNSAGNPVVAAPNLPNMHIARYDSRKNTQPPHNYYLSTVYQCDSGYYMLDTRFSELYCSRGQWVGISPVCVKYP